MSRLCNVLHPGLSPLFILAAFALAGPLSSARAQPVVIAPGQTVPSVTTTGNGDTVDNAGTVNTDIITTGDNSGVSNSGTVNNQIITTGDNSGVSNSGTVNNQIIASGNNSGVSNSGSVGTDLFTVDDNSGVTNSGSVGNNLITTGDNSGVTNSGSVGNNLITTGDNSGVTNSGSVGGFLNTAGDNSDVINSGSVGGFLATTGDNSPVTNSGFVGNGILINGLNPTLILLPGSLIQGPIDLIGPGPKTLVVGNGLNVSNTFVTGPTVINANGAPFAQSGNQVAVVDPTGLAMQDEVIVDLTNGISGAVFSALNGSRNGNVNGSNGESPMFLTGPDASATSAETGFRYWSSVFGSKREQQGESPTVDAEHWIGGTVSGLDTQIASNIRAGGFLGGSTGEVNVDFASQETEIDSFFGGLYAGTQFSSIAIDFVLSGGWTNHDRERRVANNLAAGGIQTARADFDGTFISPEIKVSLDTGFGLVPSARIRYAHFDLDGFSERGAADNFTVGDRDMEILHGRFQIAAPIDAGGGARVEPYIGVEARSLVSGDRIDAVLLGQNISFDPGGDDDVVSGYAGINMFSQITGNIQLFGNAEINFEEEDTYRIGGNAGVKMRF